MQSCECVLDSCECYVHVYMYESYESHVTLNLFILFRHKSLSTRLSRWSCRPSLHLHFLPRVWWTVGLLLPGTFLLLGMLFFSHAHQPLGFVLALFAVGGFFWSLSGHRLSHDCRWPNPALFGALLSGMIHTGVCYFVTVLPNILLPFLFVCLHSLIIQ